jgi:hypothetical protein
MAINGMSNYLENELINHLLRNIRYIPPAHVYLALYTATPTDTYAGVEVSSTSTGYSRMQCPVFNISANHASASEEIKFGPATQDWGIVASFALMDGSTGGNMLLFGSLNNALDIYDLDSIIISGSSFSVSLVGNEYGGWGDETASNILDGILNNNGLDFPGATIYLALGRVLVTNSSNVFLSWLEVGGAGYSRKLIGNNWSNPTVGSTINTTNITFTEKAAGNWGNVANCALFNSSSTGDVLFWGTLSPPRNVLIGDAFEFSSGCVVLNLTSGV